VEVDWEKLLPPKGFQVLPRRWVVERTFSWIDHNRRMSKDYERLTETSEAFIYVAMSRLMVRDWLAHEAFRTVSEGAFSEGLEILVGRLLLLLLVRLLLGL
jgi:hypothetical protein